MTEDPSRPPPPIPAYDPEVVPTRQDREVRATGDAAATTDAPGTADALAEHERERALERLKAKREFMTHLTIYWLVMTFLVVIWLVTMGWGEYFWPIWPMLGWGLGVAIHGASLHLDREPSEEEIAAEVARLQQRRQHRR